MFRISNLRTIKGQVISKGLFGVLEFSQKTNERIRRSSKNEFVHSFFGRIRGYRKSFRNYLTLKVTSKPSGDFCCLWFPPKIERRNSTLLLWYLKWLVFIHFLEEIEDTKKHFDIIWPLTGSIKKLPKCWKLYNFYDMTFLFQKLNSFIGFSGPQTSDFQK